MEATKTCTKCGTEYPATAEYFYRDKTGRDGLRLDCKACHCEQSRLYHAANRERVHERQGRYRKANQERIREYLRNWQRENRDRTREYSRRWYENNRERHYENGRRWVSDNAERVRQYRRCWRKATPERTRAEKHRRRARKRNAEGSHTAEDLRKLRELQTRCWWCGKRIKGDDFHIDHLVPLARGGTNNPDNLVIACPACNTSKQAKLPHEWNGRLF